jgi:aromatic ring-opening dioxygenase LigB subunit
MPLCFAAIVPHSYALLPSLANQKRYSVAGTHAALSELSEELYAANPDALVVLTPHGIFSETTFSLNLSNEYRSDFSAIGDFSETRVYAPSVKLAQSIRSAARAHHLPLHVTSVSTLDMGTAIPLYFLGRDLRVDRILPLSDAGLSLDEHWKLGAALSEVFHETLDRIAVLCSAELAHCLSHKAPEPYNERGKELDQSILDAMQHGRILPETLDPELLAVTKACGIRPLKTLEGVLSQRSISVHVIHYEAPVGIGFLTASILFS